MATVEVRDIENWRGEMRRDKKKENERRGERREEKRKTREKGGREGRQREGRKEKLNRMKKGKGSSYLTGSLVSLSDFLLKLMEKTHCFHSILKSPSPSTMSTTHFKCSLVFEIINT